MTASIAATWIAGSWRPEFATAGRVLSPPQLRDLDAISALILPSDEMPGAREAHVVDFIDRSLASFAADQRPLFDAGLSDLNARVARRHAGVVSFADLGADDATALLVELEGEGSAFFETMRVATITGFLANPEYGFTHPEYPLLWPWLQAGMSLIAGRVGAAISTGGCMVINVL